MACGRKSPGRSSKACHRFRLVCQAIDSHDRQPPRYYLQDSQQLHLRLRTTFLLTTNLKELRNDSTMHEPTCQTPLRKVKRPPVQEGIPVETKHTEIITKQFHFHGKSDRRYNSQVRTLRRNHLLVKLIFGLVRERPPIIVHVLRCNFLSKENQSTAFWTS